MSNNVQSALPIGTILKSKKTEYHIDKVLGAGSFGITYLATTTYAFGNIEQTIQVAIKEHFMDSCFRGQDGIQVLCTPASESGVKESREDFLAEADRLKDICKKSRYIVNVNETFKANGTSYYVMEYLDGGHPKKMSEDDAVKLVKRLAEAVGMLHDNNLLHLDIKPENIMLKKDANGTYPVLIDFGIAKHFDSKGNPTSRLHAKGATDGYAPQEQYAKVDKFTPKYDVYALGAVLLYLLTGKNPPKAFDIHANQQELMALIPTNVSDSTRNAILEAMAPSAFDRTPDTKAFINNLPDVMSIENDSNDNGSHTDTVVLGHQDSFWDKNKKLIISICVIAVAVIAAVVIINIFGGNGESEPVTEPVIEQEPIANDDPKQESNNEAQQIDVEPSQTEPIKEEGPNKVEQPTQPTQPTHNSQQTNPNKPTTQDKPSEPKLTQGQIQMDLGRWKGGISNGKAHGLGTIVFTESGSFYGVDVEPGNVFTGEFNNGHLVHGKIYEDANYGRVISRVMP